MIVGMLILIIAIVVAFADVVVFGAIVYLIYRHHKNKKNKK